MLDLRGLRLVHPNGQRALDGVSLHVKRGERLAVIGPSGAGKTTLLRIAGTSLRPNTGDVQVLGEAPWGLAARQLRTLRARIGTIHQAAPIPPRLRVVSAVLAGRLGRWGTWRALASLAHPADAAGAHAALARLDLGDRLFDRCDRLSGGQLQRVGIARVLYQAPDLILADEPVSALDPTSADAALRALVAQCEGTGVTLVASLHALDLALRWFDRIVGMREGRIEFDLPREQVTQAMLQQLYAGDPLLPIQPPVDADSALDGEARAPVLMCR
ncbi:ATP-binding cassette domain-containing protein [Variovorax dokdonensis]|uniref:ATP-binding cassette domain-containing protein n=1 Tax=Variovorax dokdonensis TaxID=344883 RepID=A0ABT7NBQ5_9BURK|nr:ATP-binding cassette domain-containing protein [Variovorax dokdonensis]MDM0045373.1 ATP-binding cassette domain-containing protein [Variovorax dokdonensis]